MIALREAAKAGLFRRGHWSNNIAAGLVVGVVCLFFCTIVKNALGYDDARLGEFDLGEGEIVAGDAPEGIAAKIAFQEVRAIQATMAALDLDATDGAVLEAEGLLMRAGGEGFIGRPTSQGVSVR